MATRRERVVLELEDSFSTEMARAAAAAALLKRELNDLSGTAVRTSRASATVDRDMNRIARSADRTDTSINQLTGRLRVLADVAAILGPGLVPIGAVGIPAVTGLAQQLGFAAVAGGSAIVAFQGVGDALTAVNDAALEPTTDNLRAAEAALNQLSPAAATFVTELAGMRDQWIALRDAGAEALFPGLTSALDSLESRLPDLQRIIVSTNEALGDVIADGAESLASDRWDAFFDYIATDAPAALSDLGKIIGNTTHAMAEMWMAFDPINDDFSSWLVDLTDRWDEWAQGLSETQGFQEFMDYLRESGPQVADAMGALGNALLQVLEAASPLGGPVLRGIEAFSDAVAAIADSDIGTPIMAGVTALALFNRASAVTRSLMATTWGGKAVGRITAGAGALMTVTTAQERATRSAQALAAAERNRQATMRRGVGMVGRMAGSMGLMAVAASDMDDSLGITNTTLGAMIGMLGGPWGAAFGAAVGAVLDLRDAFDGFEKVLDDVDAAIRAGDMSGVTDGLSKMKAELDDFENQTGFLDTLGDIRTSMAATFSGNFDFAGNLRSEINRAEGALDDLRGGAVGGQEALSTLFSNVESGAAGSADALQNAAQSADEFGESLARLNRFLEGRANMRDYEAAIDDFTASMKENGRSFDINTEKGRNNQEALDGIVSTALQVAEGLKGIERVEFLEGTAQQVRQFARRFNIPRDQVRGLLRELEKLGAEKVEPKVGLEGDDQARGELAQLKADLRRYGLTRENATAALNDVASGKINTIQGLVDKYGISKREATALLADLASGKINSVLGLLNSLDGRHATSTSTHVHTEIRRVVNQSAPLTRGVTSFFGSAEGSTVPKDGGPYGDRYPYMLAPGEEVISNRFGQADRFRELLKAINSNRLADGGTAMPGLATGGTARRRYAAGFVRTDDGDWYAPHRRGVRALTRELKRSEKALSEEREERKAVVDNMRDVRRDTRSALRSNLFDMPDDPWSSGGLDVNARLRDDIAEAREWRRSVRDLERKGVSGGALQLLLNEGDVDLLSNYAGQSRSDLRVYQDLVQQRNRVTNRAANTTADARWGDALQQQTRELRAQRRETRGLRQDLKQLEKAFDKAVARAQRNRRR